MALWDDWLMKVERVVVSGQDPLEESERRRLDRSLQRQQLASRPRGLDGCEPFHGYRRWMDARDVSLGALPMGIPLIVGSGRCSWHWSSDSRRSACA